MMKLIKFRVTNFRSVDDSGWILVDNVTSLIGTNESGKTNLILPLWKLNPAKDGEINLLADSPRKRYNEIKNMQEKPIFIEVYLELSEDLIQEVIKLTSATKNDVKIVYVARKLDGGFIVNFPEASIINNVSKDEVKRILLLARDTINEMNPASKAEDPIKNDMISSIDRVIGNIEEMQGLIDRDSLKNMVKDLEAVSIDGAARRSTIVPRYGQMIDDMNDVLSPMLKQHPTYNADARKFVVSNLPSFVYYSNYGNLDSEIYLPHVIENMARGDLGSREEAKVRTLKVLFDFVKLEPQEILELGQDIPNNQVRPTDEQIKQVSERKKEREVLLQSASSELTQKFRDWWKQGNYRLRFQADGAHFRIWVSDDKRPEEIELEGRSTGLQWFLSFYLIFLVESADEHQDAILLLDEPGLSLHPLSQRDLSLFFENLSKSNQIIYTTHSPFMVDSNHLDRVRSVYINENGTTVASSNLRAGEADPAQSKSIYAVHAALGLSVSDGILQGCHPIIVEGPSDQFYLNAIKTYLIRNSLLNPRREIVFIPSGGVKGISATAGIITAKDEMLPYVILDSDKSGRDMANKLKSSTYQGINERIIMIGEFVQIENAEVEDLFPYTFFTNIVTKYIRAPEEDFEEIATSGPIVPQIEAFVRNNGIKLEDGWKVELAKLVKSRLLRFNNDPLEKYGETIQIWKDIFQKINI